MKLHAIAFAQYRLKLNKGETNELEQLIDIKKREFEIWFLRASVKTKLPCNFYQKYHYLLKSTGSYLVEDLL
jgi:hypothetical protein